MLADKGLSRVAAGMAAGFAAGVVLSAAWLAIEAATEETSEVVRLGRLTLKKVGRGAKNEAAQADPLEQTLSHGGHLALSAAAGGLYGLSTPTTIQKPVISGAAFGAIFYALAYGALAPILGLRPALWREARSNVVQRGFFHLLFGILTASFTPPAGRVLASLAQRRDIARA